MFAHGCCKASERAFAFPPSPNCQQVSDTMTRIIHIILMANDVMFSRGEFVTFLNRLGQRVTEILYVTQPIPLLHFLHI